jgi:hypothetical protein
MSRFCFTPVQNSLEQVKSELEQIKSLLKLLMKKNGIKVGEGKGSSPEILTNPALDVPKHSFNTLQDPSENLSETWERRSDITGKLGLSDDHKVCPPPQPRQSVASTMHGERLLEVSGELHELFNGAFSDKVYQRTLELVDRCPSDVLVILASKDGERPVKVGPPLDASLQEFWSRHRLRVFDDLPQAALKHWCLDGDRRAPVIVHPKSGEITAIASPLIAAPNVECRPPGQFLGRQALAAVASFTCVAICTHAEQTLVWTSRDPDRVRLCDGPLGVRLQPKVLAEVHKQQEPKMLAPQDFDAVMDLALPFGAELKSGGQLSWLNRAVYMSALELASRYAKEGVEGVRKGHSLLLALPEDAFCIGEVAGLNDFRGEHAVRITDPKGMEQVRRRMNLDGMTVINGSDGKPVANNFFTTTIDHAAQGGARSKAGRGAVATLRSGGVVLLISEDAAGRVRILCGAHGEDPKQQVRECIYS